MNETIICRNINRAINKKNDLKLELYHHILNFYNHTNIQKNSKNQNDLHKTAENSNICYSIKQLLTSFQRPPNMEWFTKRVKNVSRDKNCIKHEQVIEKKKKKKSPIDIWLN